MRKKFLKKVKIKLKVHLKKGSVRNGMDSNTNPPKGRPAGSETCKRVKIQSLLDHLSTAAEIPVAQKFLTTVGIPFDKG